MTCLLEVLSRGECRWSELDNVGLSITLGDEMRHLIALGAVLCVSLLTACAADSVPEAADRSSTAAGADDGAAPESALRFPGQIDPNVTTPAIDHTFGDGCRIRFWCRNDNAAGDLAGFCILNACSGTAPAHAAAFCSSTCPSPDCNSITNFGACG
jgi:hypothetical protein